MGILERKKMAVLEIVILYTHFNFTGFTSAVQLLHSPGWIWIYNMKNKSSFLYLINTSVNHLRENQKHGKHNHTLCSFGCLVNMTLKSSFEGCISSMNMSRVAVTEKELWEIHKKLNVNFWWADCVYLVSHFFRWLLVLHNPHPHSPHPILETISSLFLVTY